MRGYKLLLFVWVEFLLCIGVESFFQKVLGISGIGIISIIYFAILNIHDMFLGKEDLEVKIIRETNSRR